MPIKANDLLCVIPIPLDCCFDPSLKTPLRIVAQQAFRLRDVCVGVLDIARTLWVVNRLNVDAECLRQAKENIV